MGRDHIYRDDSEVEFEKEYYVRTLDALGNIWDYSKPHFSKMSKEPGAPQKTDEGYPVIAWARYLVRRAEEKKSGNTPLEEATLQYRQERATILKMERETLQGDLISKKVRNEEEMSRFTELSQTLLVLPSRISAKAANKTAAEIQVIIGSEIRQILQYFEELCKKGGDKTPLRLKTGPGRPRKTSMNFS